MSADNEIAVIKFRDKWAVGMVYGCPDKNTITRCLPRGERFNQEFTLFDGEEVADNFAREMLENCDKADYWVEYGLTGYAIDESVTVYQT